MMKIIWIFAFLVMTPFTYAEDPDYDEYFNSEDSELETEDGFIENATMITGRIRSIDLSDRSVIISGYKYEFGPPTGVDRVVVKMLGRDFGAVELLQADMFVQVYFVQEPQRRLAKLIIQTEDGDEF